MCSSDLEVVLRRTEQLDVARRLAPGLGYFDRLAAREVRARRGVRIAEQLVGRALRNHLAAVKARALVGEKLAAEAEIRFMMVDQDFE